MTWNVRHTLLAGVLLASGAMLSCSGNAYYAYRVPPPPAPPAVGAVGYAPGPGYVWVSGFFDLRGSYWVWVPGRWARPPYPHATWAPSRWEREGDRYRFHPGRWR